MPKVSKKRFRKEIVGVLRRRNFGKVSRGLEVKDMEALLKLNGGGCHLWSVARPAAFGIWGKMEIAW